MIAKPSEKPVVLGWLNPPANGRLTIKQNKIKQDKVGLVPRTKPNPPYLLVRLTNKQGYFSCFFSLRSCFSRLIRAPEKQISTGFQQSFQQRHETRCFQWLEPKPTI